jgi:hypothetical protein
MIFIVPAIKSNLGQSLALRPRPQDLPNDLGGLLIPARLHLRTDIWLRGTRRHQRFPDRIVNYLGVNMLEASEDNEAGPLGSSKDSASNPKSPALLLYPLDELIVHY